MTVRLDLRCRELRALYTQGLTEYKVVISKIPKFKSGDNVSKRRRERDPDWAHVLRDTREMALEQFTRAPHTSLQVVKDVRRQLEQAVGVRKALEAIQKGKTEESTRGGAHNTERPARPAQAPSKPPAHPRAVATKHQPRRPPRFSVAICWAYVFGKNSYWNPKYKFMDTHNAKARAEFEASMSKDEFKQARDAFQRKEAADKSERRAHTTKAVPKQAKDSSQSGEVKGQRYYLATSGGKVKGKAHMTRSSGLGDPPNVDGVLWQLLRLVYNTFMRLARILFARRRADDHITIEAEAVCAAGASPLNELCYCGIRVRIY